MVSLFKSASKEEPQAAQGEAGGQSAASDNSSEVKNIRDVVMEGRGRLKDHKGIQATPLPLSEMSSFEVKNFLQERIGELSIEATINEMYTIIMHMDGQLKKVLDINSSLDKDLKISRDSLLKSNQECEELHEKIQKIEDESPLRIELQQELDQLIDEQYKTTDKIHDVEKERDKQTELVTRMEQKNQADAEEKDDAVKEAKYVNSKMDDLMLKIREHEGKVDELRGESVYYREKIKTIEEDLSRVVEERNASQMELKESKEAFDEIYEALLETKIKTKKFFYREIKE